MRMDQLPTPCYVIDEKKLKENLQILKKSRKKPAARSFLPRKLFHVFMNIL